MVSLSNHKPWRGGPSTRPAKRVAAVLLVFAALGMLHGGCSRGDQELLVFAAASLTDVLTELGESFEAREGVAVTYSFGGSAALARQVQRGARPDVFLAAGSSPMDELDTHGLLTPESRFDLLRNELVLVGPEGGAAPLSSPTALLGPNVRRIAIADPDLAPAGHYAREALRSLGLWDGVQDKLVYGPDVRTVLAYVASRSVDVGLVYATDAQSGRDVRMVLDIPEESHAPILYPVAALRHAPNGEAAARFLAYLASDPALAVFRRHGFTAAVE